MKTIIFLITLFSSYSFAAGSKPIHIQPGNVSYEIFPGDYVLTKSSGSRPTVCNYIEKISIEANASKNEVKIINCDSEECAFDTVNNSRKEFNSCFSDGLKGYSETVGNGNVIVDRTIFQKGGFFCTGEREKCRMGHYLIKNTADTLQLVFFDSCYNNSSICDYKKR